MQATAVTHPSPLLLLLANTPHYSQQPSLDTHIIINPACSPSLHHTHVT